MPILSHLLALLLISSTSGGARADEAAHQIQTPDDGALGEDSLSSRSPEWADFGDIAREPRAGQVRIERRVILRISPQPGNLRPSMLSDLPTRAPQPRLVERPYGKCVNAGDIVGVSSRSTRLVMYMRDRQILTAELEKACSPRDFYLGFYVERSDDGKLCVGRDRLMSRAGAKCQLSRLNRLVSLGQER